MGELREGMLLAEGVHLKSGSLLISRGHTVTPGMIERIRNYAKGLGIKEPLSVIDPPRPS
ncbi:hypothetical protein D3C87_1778340 [compost metagenome]